MSSLAETILATLSRRLSKSEVAHTEEMKSALRDDRNFAAYRAKMGGHLIANLQRLGIDLVGKRVLDLGCDIGAYTAAFADAGATEAIGVDVNAEAIAQAERSNHDARIGFRVSGLTELPCEDSSADVIVSYDVFEHVSQPGPLLKECRRVLASGGTMVIGTWGWGHPFAPHLWATMPVPWAHVFVSERTLLHAARRVYESSWYVPTRHDFDETGKRLPKYQDEKISTDYVNKFSVRDFERAFANSGLEWRVELQPFSRIRWTAPLLRVPFLREYLHSYLWATLTKPSL